MTKAPFIHTERVAWRHVAWRWRQGRNFGLKSGVPIHKENEAPFGPEMRGEENGEEVSFYYNLISSDRRALLTAGDSKFFTFSSWKVAVQYPQSKKLGYRYPS